MDNLTVISQGELFPTNSEYNSRHALLKRLNERAHENATESHDLFTNIKDLTGQQYGMLTVESITDERHHGGVVFICRCECGHAVKATGRHLNRKDAPLTHCGCKGIGRSNAPRPGMAGITREVRTKSNPLVAFRGLQATYRLSASNRSYSWELSEQEFYDLTTSDCQYCGAEPSQTFVRKPHEFTYNGVDRVDSSIGYTASNCVPCCGQCNVAKMDRPVSEFLEWVERVYNHQKRIK